MAQQIGSRLKPWCADCSCFVAGSYSEHVWTKKHQRAAAGPVVRRRSPRRVVRATQRRLVAQEPRTLDDPEPTWKHCAGIPSMDLAGHFEPLEAFARNRAYADGYYVRCRSCHKYYGLVWRARRAEASAGLQAAA